MNTLNTRERIKEREDLLIQKHMEELNSFVKNIAQANPNCFVPNFDPLDGGHNASALFLFEKPGPKTDPENNGSGFISRDNDDLTAKATDNFLKNIGIDRKTTILWNFIPMWNKTRSIKRAEVEMGNKYLPEFLSILKQLKVIILVGRKAQSAEHIIDRNKYRIIKSYHPSPIVRARYPIQWQQIEDEWKRVIGYI